VLLVAQLLLLLAALPLHLNQPPLPPPVLPLLQDLNQHPDLLQHLVPPPPLLPVPLLLPALHQLPLPVLPLLPVLALKFNPFAPLF
jgi:hypothetical protein